MLAKRLCGLLICALLLITFIQISEEFNFKFSNDDDENVDDDNADDSEQESEQQHTENMQLMKKAHKREKKFKFRKIERIVTDANNPQNSQQQQSAEADNSQQNEREELNFERAHKTNGRSRKKRKSAKNLQTSGEAANEEGGTSWLAYFYDSIFVNNNGAIVKDKNTIIDWLQWLGEKSGRLSMNVIVKEKSKKSIEGWSSYLNRWPFNSIFPIGETTKTNEKRKQQQKLQEQRRTTSKETSISREEEMSEENFETLLHTLPTFVLSPTNVPDTDCRQQLQIFQRQLRAYKLWTLQILDATGKISTGVLRGNINQFGDFDMCTQLRTLIKVTPDIPLRIRGKYCLAHIETQSDVAALRVPLHLLHGRGLWNSHLENPSHFIPRYTLAKWGICVPQMCTAQIVENMLIESFKPYNSSGIEFHVEVDEELDCYVQKSSKLLKLLQNDRKYLISFCILSTLYLLVLAALFKDNWARITELVNAQLQKFNFTSFVLRNKPDLEKPNEEETAEIDKQIEEITEHDNENDNEIKPTTTTETEATASPTTINMYKILKEFMWKILEIFSPQRTLNILLSVESHSIEFAVIHVLKILITFMLYICLKFLMIGHLPINNRDQLVRALNNPFSILYRAPFIYADILLFIGGFIAAYQLSEEMEKRSYIKLLKCIFNKMCRFLPTIFIVLIFHAYLQVELNAGPLWNSLIMQNANICHTQMWRNLFNLQNAIDFEETVGIVFMRATFQTLIVEKLYALLELWAVFLTRSVLLKLENG